MSDINEKIDSILSSLNESTTNITENAQDLANEITSLKSVLRKTMVAKNFVDATALSTQRCPIFLP